MVQVQANALGLDRQHTIIVDVGATAIRFQVQVGLAAAQCLGFDDVSGSGHDWGGVLAFDHPLFVVDIGNTRVNFEGVGFLGGPAVHVGRQNFDVDDHHFSSGSGMFHRVCGHDGHRITKLENLVFAENRAVPAVALV